MIPIRIVSCKSPRQEAVEIPMGICYSLKVRFCWAGSPFCGADVAPARLACPSCRRPESRHRSGAGARKAVAARQGAAGLGASGRRSSNSSSPSSSSSRRPRCSCSGSPRRARSFRCRCGAVHLRTRDGPRPGAGRRDVRSVAANMERRPGDRPVGNRVRARDLTRVGPNRLCLPFGRESIGAPG